MQRSPVRRRGDALGPAPQMPLAHPHTYHSDPQLHSQHDERTAFLYSGAGTTSSLEKLHPFASSQFHSSASSAMSNPSLFSYGRSVPGGVSMCSIRDAEQGIYEYLAEKHEPQHAGLGGILGGAIKKKPKPFSIPIRISGWLWRKEGLFRKFKRRFCVFKADVATLFIFSSDDLTNGKLLNRFVLTQVALADKQSREFRVQGYLQEREIHKKQSDSMARRKSSLPRAMPGDKQRFYLPEEETLRAVSEKSLTVWSHCFRNHMKSAIRIKRLQRNMPEHSNLNFDSDDDDDDMDEDGDTDNDINPDFQFDEPERRQQRRKQSIARHNENSRYNNTNSDDEDEGSEGMENGDYRSPSEQLCFDQENVLRITASYQALSSTTFFEEHEDEHGGGDVYKASYDQMSGQHFADSSNSNSSASRSELERANPAKSSLSSSSTSGSSSTGKVAAPASTGSSIWEDEDLLSYRVDFDAIKKKKQLSVGAFGEVWLAKYRSSQLVVVKHLKDGANNQTRKYIQLFVREIKILCKLTHKRIVTFLGVAWTMERDVQLMMEFVPGGDLRSYLNHAGQSNDGIFTNQWTWTAHQWRIAIDVIEALVYLHSLNPILLHCDIKSHNVLLGENLRAKITDFGISRYVEPDPSVVATSSNQVQQGSNDSATESLGSGWDGLGTGRWMAPEILSGGASYSVASDVYAFGVVLSEIDTCEMPYHDRIVDNADGRVVLSEDILVHQIMGQGWRPTFNAQCPDVVRELALQCLAVDPDQRPTSLEAAYRLRKAANQREHAEDLISQMTNIHFAFARICTFNLHGWLTTQVAASKTQAEEQKSDGEMATEQELTARIVAKGEEIRVLKATKDAADKDTLAAAIADLLALKNEFKSVTGKDYGPPPKPKKEKKDTTTVAAATSEEPKDSNKKSKKELNKERKKAQKSAVKSGEAAPAAAAAAPVATTPSSPKARAGKKLSDDTRSRSASPKKIKQNVEVAAAAVPKGPVGRILPVPSAEQDGQIVFSATSVLPLASFVVSKLVAAKTFVNHIKESNIVPTLTFADGSVISGDFAIARYLARSKLSLGLYGLENDAVLSSQIDSWLDFALTRFQTGNATSAARGLELLNVVLKDRTFLVGYALSLADIGVWARISALKTDVSKYANVARWLSLLTAQDMFATAEESLKALKPVVTAVPTSGGKPKNGGDRKPAGGNPSTSQKGKNTGSCPPLKDAVEGQVVTRFPPEPSGYLHIGHVKACMLNHYYAKHYNGKLIVRFDDTNPSKEKEEFEQSILGDLKRLDIVADVVTYTSDHFPKIIEFARQLIREGNAYMDNTPQEQMREERMNGINSKLRDQDPKEALELFEKMLKNDPEAAGYCLRGKIDMQAKNKTLRDPVFFRANATPHHRTGTKYCAYPTYDFACPIVDSVEGVTHALRTTEYNDRDFQYQWVLQALKLRKVHIHGFARMNFVYSVLSKRKLQWFVDNGHVEGWNDPRFPTVQGVLRRGVQVEALREFILSQGASRRITDMEWDKFWTLNKRVIDPASSRYYALDKHNSVPLTLTNIKAEVVGIPVPRHPKDASKGNKIMRFSNKLILERDDVNAFVVDEEVTLMRHGNIIIKKINKDAEGNVLSVEALDNPTGDFKKTKLKVTWLADLPDLVPITLVEFDHLMNKPKLEEGDNFQDHLTPVTRAEMVAVGDHELRNAKRGEIVQLERRGYFRVDQPYLSADKPLVLFMVPDGKAKAMSTLSTNLAHR